MFLCVSNGLKRAMMLSDTSGNAARAVLLLEAELLKERERELPNAASSCREFIRAIYSIRDP